MDNKITPPGKASDQDMVQHMMRCIEGPLADIDGAIHSLELLDTAFEDSQSVEANAFGYLLTQLSRHAKDLRSAVLPNSEAEAQS